MPVHFRHGKRLRVITSQSAMPGMKAAPAPSGEMSGMDHGSKAAPQQFESLNILLKKLL